MIYDYNKTFILFCKLFSKKSKKKDHLMSSGLEMRIP